jgi:hypothetical protein
VTRRARVVGTLGLWLGLGACSRAPAGVEELVVDDPTLRWFSGDYTQMVPPVHIPSPEGHRDQVEVWLHSESIGVVTGDDSVLRLRFGGVTAADRIEWNGDGDARRIVDVRGSHLDAHGRCTHHVLRPVDETPGARLVGMQWPCDDAGAQAWVDARMRERLAELPPFVRMPAERRGKALDGFVQRNACDGCHLEGRADATTTGALGPVDRGTDATGFFAPQSVLRDEQPLEAYGNVDRNLDDPAITVRCPEGDAETEEVRPGVSRRRCPDRRVPAARIDWQVLAKADPARRDSICASRRYLLERLGPAGASAFPDALLPCL